MRADEIINEVDWKKWANRAIKGIDAAVGGNTKGFDTSTKENVKLKQFATALYKKLNQQIESELKAYQNDKERYIQGKLWNTLDNFIDSNLGVRLDQNQSLRVQGQRLAHELASEIMNDDQTMDNNTELKRMFIIVLQKAIETRTGKAKADDRYVRAYYSNLRIRGSYRHYFSFEGDKTLFVEYTQNTDATPAIYTRATPVTNAREKQRIKADATEVMVKDISKAIDRTQIQLVDKHDE